MPDPPQQHATAKREYPDSMLLIRCGDFYELFHADATTAARILGLPITTRTNRNGAVPMTGFPCHCSQYLTRLVAAGMRIAVIE